MILSPYEHPDGIAPGDRVITHLEPRQLDLVHVRPAAILDAFARPLSFAETPSAAPASQRPPSLREIGPSHEAPLTNSPPPVLLRQPIGAQFCTGIRSIDALCPLAVGQRIGLFSGPGSGKSTLVGMIVRNAACDRVIVALVGERGREVRELIDDLLRAGALHRSIVIVTTSDEPPLRRVLAVQTATAIAESYRARGEQVLLIVDSLTRMARALRDVSLAAGELPIRQGFTASVYSELPRLLERAGMAQRGAITAIYLVLSQTLQDHDALAEEVKSLLDGHIVLSAEIAARGIRPAIDLANSVSRCQALIHDADRRRTALALIQMVTRLQREREIALLGGKLDPALRAVLAIEEAVWKFISQERDERSSLEQSFAAADAIAQQYAEKLAFESRRTSQTFRSVKSALARN